MEKTMIATIKKLLSTPTPLEMVVRELVQAQRSKLEAETAQDYASNMVQYNDDRICRLRVRLTELQGE
jgi:hypothetical protein